MNDRRRFVMRFLWMTTPIAVLAALASAAPALAVPPETTIIRGPSGPTNANEGGEFS